MRIVLTAVAALTLTACNPASEPAATPSAPATEPLTAEGWGALKIGMTETQAAAAVPGGFKPETTTGAPEECRMRPLVSQPDVWVMLEKSVVTRITAHQKAPLLTDKGLGLGATTEQVMAAYPPAAITQLPHKYAPPPARDLYVWTIPGEKGVRYEVGPDNTVTEIHVGGPSIRYVEACS